MKYLRRVLGVIKTDEIGNVDITKHLNIESIKHLIERRKLNWWGHQVKIPRKTWDDEIKIIIITKDRALLEAGIIIRKRKGSAKSEEIVEKAAKLQILRPYYINKVVMVASLFIHPLRSHAKYFNEMKTLRDDNKQLKMILSWNNENIITLSLKDIKRRKLWNIGTKVFIEDDSTYDKRKIQGEIRHGAKKENVNGQK